MKPKRQFDETIAFWPRVAYNERHGFDGIENGDEYSRGLIKSIKLRNLEAKKEALQEQLAQGNGPKDPRDILKEIETINRWIYKFKSEMK